MGNCWSCFQLPPQPTAINQLCVPEHQHPDTMELRRLYSSNLSTKDTLTPLQLQINGNKKVSNTTATILTSNNVTSHSASSPIATNNPPLSHPSYAKQSLLAPSIQTTTMPSNDIQPQLHSSQLKLNVLFDSYKDPHEDLILADGIERLCNDLQLSPDDFKVLVLAWKLDAEQMCQFKRQEFVNGFTSLQVDNIRGVQLRLPQIVHELKTNGDMFKHLYRFTFRFGLDVSSGQRILPVDMAIVLWKLVFTIREPPLLSRWLQFLETHHIRGIPRDTWNMFLNFAEVIGNDLGTYDDAEAWPSLFDDFVEYENDQVNQNISKDDIVKDSIIHNI